MKCVCTHHETARLFLSPGDFSPGEWTRRYSFGLVSIFTFLMDWREPTKNDITSHSCSPWHIPLDYSGYDENNM